MANRNRAYPENAAGDFFVDDTCIDCDLCRQIAPSVFKEDADHSFVYHQPDTAVEAHRAAMALVACPTGSIGAHRKLDSKAAAAVYPELIDSPRLARTLVRRIEELGGISLMFFSHKDDVAEHQKFHEHFGCRRIIHREDARGIQAEQLLEGQEPAALDEDLLAIPVPGHTRGHV